MAQLAAMVALILLAVILFGVGIVNQSTRLCMSGMGVVVIALIVSPSSYRTKE